MPSREPIDGNCNARLTDGSGLYCEHQAGWGTEHKGFGQCRKHGGSTRNGVKNGATLRAKGEFGRLVEMCALDVAGRTIEEALSDVIDRCGAMALAWFEVLSGLRENADWKFAKVKGPQGSVQRWVTIEVEGLIGPNHQGEQRVHVANDQYRLWVREYLNATKVAADLGLEERKVRHAEAMGDVIRRVVDAVLAEQGVDPGDVGPAVAKHLRLVASS